MFLLSMAWKSHGFWLEQNYPVKEVVPDGKDVFWDSRRGFVLPSHVISYAGVGYCQTHIQNETFQSMTYVLAVIGKEESSNDKDYIIL